MVTVVVQKWEERERGWGSRPDGYSVHLTDDDRCRFIAAYWARMPDKTPDEYSRPLGTPYEAEVVLSPEDEVRLAASGGVREFTDNYPGSGGVDGWVKTGPGSHGLLISLT